jgi:hypothetical protein
MLNTLRQHEGLKYKQRSQLVFVFSLTTINFCDSETSDVKGTPAGNCFNLVFSSKEASWFPDSYLKIVFNINKILFLVGMGSSRTPCVLFFEILFLSRLQGALSCGEW